MKIGFEYIKYRRKAKFRHGVHSPFVYDFTDVCLRSRIEPDDFSRIKSLVNQLLRNNESIEITDLGAGSKKLGRIRKISEIAQNSGSRGKYGELLYRICRHYRPQHILELGTSLGIGTSHMALGYPEAKITTVEGCPETRATAVRNFEHLGISVNSVNQSFDSFLGSLPDSQVYDLIFIDGHHDGKALIRYMNELRTYAHGETIFILDDIRWSDSMFEAWNELKSSDEFHLSLDLFRVGILLRRPQQAKEEFAIRY